MVVELSEFAEKMWSAMEVITEGKEAVVHELVEGHSVVAFEPVSVGSADRTMEVHCAEQTVILSKRITPIESENTKDMRNFR
uniref:Uncharacterized protein n=1 Tax=Setaria digitata TaxID=48799 RepID=A0A915PIN6_9BILA